MIHVEGLHKRFGDRVLFEDVSWHVKKRDRIGLTGTNGSGKTTLLRLLSGIERPDAGSIRMASSTSIGYLPQDGIVHHGRTVHEEVVLAFEPLLELRREQRRIEDLLADLPPDHQQQERLLDRYAEVTDRFKQLDGWEIDARISDVLQGLGFAALDRERRTEEFSGGWQMRIALAKLLLSRPNLLLLDEPTNHLDLPARNWLEEYLADYAGAVVLVSHDRYFLDATVRRITEVGLRSLTDYHGDYSHYSSEHAARMERLIERHRRQTEDIERATAFINRFRYQATKARQVQSRIKMLEKIERIEIPPQRKRIRFRFPEAPRPGRIVLDVEDIHKAFGEKHVLAGVNLIIERGDRVGLVGPNGAGKSTLMRILAGVDLPDRGRRLLGHRVMSEYFAQNQAEVLCPDNTIYEEMEGGSPTTMVPMIREILGGFLFSGDDVHKKVSVLSGGERNRLAIARMLLKPSNVLLLDEPTNHLDLDSKEILLESLLDYCGTLVFVSHDRYFVDRLATKVVDVGSGHALLYPGGYEDFLAMKERGAVPPLSSRSAVDMPQEAVADRSTKPPPAQTPAIRGKRRSKKTPDARSTHPNRDPLAPRLQPRNAPPDRHAREREARRLKSLLGDVERRIAEHETEMREIERQMSAPGFYANAGRATQAVARYQSLRDQLSALMTEWESFQETFDKTSRSASIP
ncbi:MAG: ABC-F family ATP-binding cassette domain-containing protein [Vicinamibacteria bacterium]|nr:ABC-F family ATP-binding cassette domain-containing protein [Vicinamibacteria bacterium]